MFRTLESVRDAHCQSTLVSHFRNSHVHFMDTRSLFSVGARARGQGAAVLASGESMISGRVSGTAQKNSASAASAAAASDKKPAR